MKANVERVSSAIVLVLSLTGCGDSRSSPPASQSELSAPGAYAVATRELTLVDTSRSTQPNAEYPGAPDRTLVTRIWYPQGEGPFPIIGYAHGFISSRFEAADIKAHLASHGYVVVAPDFPLSNGGAPGGPTIADMGNQPGDIAFVMDAVARLGGENADLAHAVDTHRRGIMGLSLGGGTTLIGAFHPVLHLANVQAAVVYTPLACLFGPAFYAHALPTVLVAGDADELIPFDGGAGHAFALAPPPITVVKLHGGTHVGFIGLDLPGADNSDQIGCDAVSSAVGRNSSGTELLVAKLTEGTTPDVVVANGCGTGVCEQRFHQTMTATRQAELARVIALAHFEAELRGRKDAARFLSQALADQNPDVEVSSKH